jgi:hypothetical protein
VNENTIDLKKISEGIIHTVTNSTSKEFIALSCRVFVTIMNRNVEVLYPYYLRLFPTYVNRLEARVIEMKQFLSTARMTDTTTEMEMSSMAEKFNKNIAAQKCLNYPDERTEDFLVEGIQLFLKTYAQNPNAKFEDIESSFKQTNVVSSILSDLTKITLVKHFYPTVPRLLEIVKNWLSSTPQSKKQ